MTSSTIGVTAPHRTETLMDLGGVFLLSLG